MDLLGNMGSSRNSTITPRRIAICAGPAHPCDVRNVLFLTAVIGLLLGLPGLRAQGPTSPTTRFEVASVKPTPPGRQNELRFDYCQPSGRFAMFGTPVIWSITYAYRVKDYQIVGAPDWLRGFETAYDIE